MRNTKNVTLMYYTTNAGRYYIDGLWIGNFYTDSNGIARDTETGREV